jgi:hypothetical protein
MGKTQKIKEKKPMFNKIAPKIQDAMNSKPGQVVQTVFGITSKVLTIGTGLFTIANIIVGIHDQSQQKINKAKEIEANYPD